MQDERNAPQDDDEVEAHRQQHGRQQHGAPAEEPGRNALEDDDEVEAHRQQHGAPSEQHAWEPSE
jgi:hypothetical protein